MSVTEIILLVLGILVFILSFILPARQKNQTDGVQKVDEEQIRGILDKEVEEAKKHINDIVDETITYSMEKTERSMDRLTNEKMMAVNEYSDTVLEQINKNHKEAVFLYDMLNDKHESLKTTVSEAVKTVTEVKQTVKDVEITAREAEEKAREVQESLQMTESREWEAFAVTEEDLQPAVSAVEEVRKTAKEAGREENTAVEETADFVPIKPKRVEIIAESEMQEEPSQKKAARKSKAEKVDLNLTSPQRVGKQNNNERILELHKAGKSNMAIAKELGLGIGEVKLVIDLFEGI